jgi:mRNA-degrading endonuclease RelE of RelBE toxin-antitoxin system
VVLGDGFKRALQKLDPNLQKDVQDAVRKFRERSAENSLRPEKKSGLKGTWAFRVNSAVRVFYVQRRDDESAYSDLFHVGPHNDYRTAINKQPPAPATLTRLQTPKPARH